MIPRIQLDDQVSDAINDQLLYVTDANRLVLLSLNEVKKFQPTKAQMDRSKNFKSYSKSKTNKFQNLAVSEIKQVNSFCLFQQQDIRDFKKKDDFVASFSEFVYFE